MGYRVNRKPVNPEDTLPRFPVRNGSVMGTELECFYIEFKPGHNPHWHDHVGWPDPHHPGHACQMPFHRDGFRWLSHGRLYREEIMPIDLIEEGFAETCLISFDQPDTTHLAATAHIDSDNPNRICFGFNAQLETFEDKPIEKRFTLLLYNEEDDFYQSVLRGILVILPGAPSYSLQPV